MMVYPIEYLNLFHNPLGHEVLQSLRHMGRKSFLASLIVFRRNWYKFQRVD